MSEATARTSRREIRRALGPVAAATLDQNADAIKTVSEQVMRVGQRVEALQVSAPKYAVGWDEYRCQGCLTHDKELAAIQKDLVATQRQLEACVVAIQERLDRLEAQARRRWWQRG